MASASPTVMQWPARPTNTTTIRKAFENVVLHTNSFAISNFDVNEIFHYDVSVNIMKKRREETTFQAKRVVNQKETRNLVKEAMSKYNTENHSSVQFAYDGSRILLTPVKLTLGEQDTKLYVLDKLDPANEGRRGNYQVEIALRTSVQIHDLSEAMEGRSIETPYNILNYLTIILQQHAHNNGAVGAKNCLFIPNARSERLRSASHLQIRPGFRVKAIVAYQQILVPVTLTAGIFYEGINLLDAAERIGQRLNNFSRDPEGYRRDVMRHLGGLFVSVNHRNNRRKVGQLVIDPKSSRSYTFTVNNQTRSVEEYFLQTVYF
ncbi:Protein argonaute 7, partial [Nowakowskiella sp. JEL0078]